MHPRLPWSASILVLTLVIGASSLSAQSLRIAPSASYPTIQSAIAASINGDMVEVPPGSYQESLDLLGLQITLRSQAGPATTFMASPNRVILANSQESRDTRIEGFTFTGTHLDASATIEVTNSGLSIENCVFTGITGIALISGYNGVQESSTLRGNNANIGIIDCRFEYCRARDGLLDNSLYSHPGRGSHGGAISMSGGTLEIEDSLFLGNEAGDGGAYFGGGLNGYPGDGGSGGALWLSSTNTTITRTRFEANRAGSGSTDVSGPGFHGSGGNGGAIARSGSNGALRISDCYFIGNEAGRAPVAPFALEGSGGAILNDQGTVFVARGVFMANAAEQGGAVDCPAPNWPAGQFVENSIFIANIATMRGGACSSGSKGASNIRHCDFIANEAPDGAAIHAAPSITTTRAANSIFAGSVGPDFGPLPGTGPISASFTNNLIAQVGLPGSGNFSGDPGFVDAANLDFRLRPDSICIDAGVALVPALDSDFDLEARGFGLGVDVGADEFVGLGPAASGTVPDGQGGRADVLLVNGSAGGNSRYIVLPLGSAPLWRIDPLPASVDPDHFILWGRIGIPAFDEAYPLVFLGTDLCFAPQPVDWFNPAKFLFANSFDPAAPALTPSIPAPFAVQAPAFNFPIAITVQGLILDDGLQFHVTNAIAVEIR